MAYKNTYTKYDKILSQKYSGKDWTTEYGEAIMKSIYEAHHEQLKEHIKTDSVREIYKVDDTDKDGFTCVAIVGEQEYPVFEAAIEKYMTITSVKLLVLKPQLNSNSNESTLWCKPYPCNLDLFWFILMK